jgi:hypothetical protein
MKKGVKTTVFLLVIICLCGCTVPTHIYVRNNSNQSETLTLTKRKHSNELLSFLASLKEISDKELSFKLADKLSSTLISTTINDSVCQISIPAHALVLLEKTYNFHSSKFTSAKIGDVVIIEDRFRFGTNKADTKKDNLGFIRCYNIQR